MQILLEREKNFVVGCALSCIRKLMFKVFNQAWIAQNKEGGFVEDEALKDWGM